jgi:pyridoxal phosphate enzyme (YggS family)
MPEIADALSRIHARIAAACSRAGRAPSSVTLVAVSKTMPAQRVRDAMAAGQSVFGENRVQEALGKIPEVGGEARWHLIGHLQRNKARQVVGAFELIHSLDGAKLARELDRRCAAAGTVQPVLLQLNLSRESTKHGVGEAGLGDLLDTVAELPRLEPRGLMTIPPPVDDPEDNRRWFARLRELAEHAAGRLGRPLPELSMGMTDDFEVAIEEGATLVRVGRALFGERETAPRG